MMRYFTAAFLLLFSLSAWSVMLPSTPLEPVYNALFNKQNSLAWQQLINLWPQVSSAAQRTAWQQARDVIVSGQCGNDLPVTVPDWLDTPTLVLIQRDIPLNRIYRVQLRGKSQRRDLQVSLTLPGGKEITLGAEDEYEPDGDFQLESDEQGKALPAGVYQLTVRSGKDVWQHVLALPSSGGLNWIQRQGQQIHLQPPMTALACPTPWLEQRLLKRSDYTQVWWQKNEHPRLQPWPSRNDTAELWANVSVVRIEAQGGLTLRTEHQLAGPLLTLQN
jgi:hypothetical protein